MSEPFFDFRRPFDVTRHPTLEPEVKRAILASWASDSAAVESRPALRQPPGAPRAVAVDEVLSALRALDGSPAEELRRGDWSRPIPRKRVRHRR
jgi:uncharacterized protein YbjT (DUF2867 family)